MSIKIGDRVRFLNAVGGGTVVRIDKVQNLVYVEDEDGFEIPVLERECVVIGEVNEKTNFIKKDFSLKTDNNSADNTSKEPKVQVAKPTVREPIVETAGGDILQVLLAFFPVDIKQLQTTSYDCLLINDSNYFLFYNIVNGEKGYERSVAHGLIEPNIQEEICSITKEQLNDWGNIRIQILAFKEAKNYTPQNLIDVDIKMNVVRFYKLHSFSENEYFDEPAMIIDIKKESEKSELTNIPTDEIKNALLTKKIEAKNSKSISKPHHKPGVTEIDLHITELVDTTTGMSNADMLELQMEKFHATIQEFKNKKGHKIVFIHGKGEGVLRKEIEKQLKTKYKSYYYQDASFREYGFGATMVTIK